MIDSSVLPNKQVNEVRLEVNGSYIYIDFIQSDTVADLKRIIAGLQFSNVSLSQIKIFMEDLTVKNPS